MKAKRIFLATGVGLLIVSAGHRVGAGVTGEVEADGYGGETSGRWICGPMGTARYAGGAVQATVAQRDLKTPEGQSEGQGTVGTLAMGVEGESISLVEGAKESGVAPPSRAMLGGQFKAGYRWRWVGVEGGMGFLQGWEDASSNTPELMAYPSIEVSFGLRNKAYGVIGGGAPLATSLRRPGIYTGGGFVVSDGFALDLRVGAYRQGPATLDALGPRIDLSGRGLIPGTDTVWLRLGANVGFPDSPAPLDFEGSAGLIVGY